jgi:hypothetical protein
MNASFRLALCATPILVLLAVACGTERRASRPPIQPGWPATTTTPPRATSLYGAEEALRDALSGTWNYVGTGSWPGNGRMQACAFRNERVIVVNVYCGVHDTQAFRLEVYSPTRGRVRIYAESKAPVSEHVRPQYFTFTAESEPPPRPDARLPPLDLGMSYDALRSYDETRHAAYLPACYGGLERNAERSGCLGTLAPQTASWTRQNGPFLEHASDDWYRVVHELRALAARYGKDPK